MNKPNYTLLTFDSKLFGYKVAQLSSTMSTSKVEQTLIRLKANGVKLVYWMIKPKDKQRNNISVKLDGKLVDEKITYRIYINQAIEHNPDVHNFKEKAASPELVRIAVQGGDWSRFARDQHFIHNESAKLYKIWIQKSVRGEIAKEVLIYQGPKGVIKGLVTVGIKQEKGYIGLFVVEKKHRGQSVGTTLMNEALRHLFGLGYRSVVLDTQKDNRIACRFYEKIGFREVESKNVYHFWL